MNNAENEKLDQYPDIDLKHIFTLLVSKLWLILLTGLIGAACMFFYASYMLVPKYQSSAMFYVNNNNINIGSTSFSISSADISASQSLINTYSAILKTRNTLETVIEKSQLNYSYSTLVSMLSASSVNGTEIFRVTVTASDPVEACKIANGITEVLPDKISEIVTGSGARIVDYAVVNPNKVYPSTTRYVGLGLLFGMGAACVLIILIDLLDDTITSDSYLLNSYPDIPTLAVIPNLMEKKKSHYYYKYSKHYYNRHYYKNYKYSDYSKVNNDNNGK